MSTAKNSLGAKNILSSSSCNPEFLNPWVRTPCVTVKVLQPYAVHTKASIAPRGTLICPKLDYLACREFSCSYPLAKAGLCMICISIFHCSRRIICGHINYQCWQVPLSETQATCICIMRVRLREACCLCNVAPDIC